MKNLPCLSPHWLRVVLALLLTLCGLRVLAQPSALLLDSAAGVVDAWPAVTLVLDTDRQLTAEQALSRPSLFGKPSGHHANLGVVRHPVWLRIPLRLAEGDSGRWMFSLAYASIDHIDLHVVTDGQIARHVKLGRAVPLDQRPYPSAWHAVPLELEPGRQHELLLRVESLSSMVLPISLAKPERFHSEETNEQALQGLLMGISLCLILYSLMHWLTVRDTMFLAYALVTAGATVFFLAYYGLGPQHLWGDNAWLTLHAAPLAVLLGLVGSFLFVERILGVREVHPRLARVMTLGSVLAGATAVLFTTGVLGYRAAQGIATVLGPLPMLLAIPVAWMRTRRGERVGLTMLLSWGAYAVATTTMAALLRGLVPANFMTLHAFQFGALVEMLLWMRVLAWRVEDIQQQAQRVHHERDALQTLANTDALTGLPNRRGLQRALDTALPGCTPSVTLAVFMLDLDGFKPINDRLGHDAGDELLVQVGRRLKGLVRADDIVARVGGDEFVVLVTQISSDEQARKVGQKLLDNFLLPFEVNAQLCRVGLTIGYAIAPQDGADAASLLKRADAAMYAGKEAGRHCLRRSGEALEMAGA